MARPLTGPHRYASVSRLPIALHHVTRATPPAPQRPTAKATPKAPKAQPKPIARAPPSGAQPRPTSLSVAPAMMQRAAFQLSSVAPSGLTTVTNGRTLHEASLDLKETRRLDDRDNKQPSEAARQVVAIAMKVNFTADNSRWIRCQSLPGSGSILYRYHVIKLSKTCSDDNHTLPGSEN